MFWATHVHAATVAIVRPPNPSPALAETLSRLHGELLSVGLEVEITQRSARRLGATELRAWLEKLVTERGVEAIIESVDDATPVAVDIWLIDKATRRLDVSRVELEPNTPNPSERLAIRAIEVLRSSFLEIDLAERARRGGAIAKSSTSGLPLTEVNKPASYAGRIGVEVGAAALTSLVGVGPALLPMLGFDWAAQSWLVVHAALAGLGSTPIVATAAGNTRIAQQYGVVGGRYRFRSDQRLQPFLALSAGVLRTSLDGQANPPKLGHAIDQWSFLLDASLGTALRLSSRYYATLAAHVHVAAPYVAIHFVDDVVATSGHPNLLLTLTVGAWL
jgi:hypothetical protein